MNRSIYIGWDPREVAAFVVARYSVYRHLESYHGIPVNGLVLSDLISQGLYSRPMELRLKDGVKVMWDTLSDAPMSTQHANARFLTPHLAALAARVEVNSIGSSEPKYLAGQAGWALFMDGDMLVRGNIAEAFEGLDKSKAVYCVHHKHEPPPGLKMDGQMQTLYARKNWSSFVIFNCDHQANKGLTLEIINTLPGRDLHRFCWLDDSEIGALDPKWNFLVGHSDPAIDPMVVHFTSGTPDMPGYENVPYADEWRTELERQAL